MPLPAKVLRKGITDMVRISDGRMSGTAYGTVVLHVAPEGCWRTISVGADGRHDRARCAEAPGCTWKFPMRTARRKGAWKVTEPPARGW